MRPDQLSASSFAAYPPLARKLATEHLALLGDLPPVLVPILLRELITYDWKLPAERRGLERQISFLIGMTASERTSAMKDFRALPLPTDLVDADWVNNPSAFMERLTAWLWSTHRMDGFRAIADSYASAVNERMPEPQPAIPRLGIVILGAGAERSSALLFRKLRPAGVYLSRVKPEDGLAILLEHASLRSTPDHGPGAVPQKDSGAEYLHWYVEGGVSPQATNLTHVSYEALEPSRAMLLTRIQEAIDSGKMGPEELRSLLARMSPSQVGLTDSGPRAVLDHFQLTLLTEGAGTQIFATTFVQWAARECVRRAQPETLVVRYAPRQRAQTLNTMLSGAKPVGLDPEGSLVDADLGAFYTWLNMRRLTGADQLRFLVWFEGHREALVIGPGLPRATSSDSPMHMHQVLALLG